MTFFWDEIKKEKRPIVIYGTGDAAEKTFNMLKERGIRVMAFSSSTEFLRNRSFLGYKVLPLERIKEIYGNDIVLLLGFGSHEKAVIDHIIELSKEFDLYMPDLLLSEDGEAFDSSYFEKHREEIEWAYSLLSDDLSREVFSSTLEYRMTGRIEPLLKINREEEENWNLLNIKEGDSFFDCGAYNGDTISLFIKKAGIYKEIYGVEPSGRSFKKLYEKYGGHENIHLYNTVLGESDGYAGFEKGHGRGNKIGEGVRIEKRSIDSILSGRSIDIIKYDIEGEEEKGLEGARRTIEEYKPRILLSTYHRTDDYWKLLNKVFLIRDDYKVYMRKNSALPNWDVAYYLV